MIHLDELFKGKKITQMGLGLLGRGIGDASFLARHGADLIVTDMKNEQDLSESLRVLAKYEKHITYHLGGHREEDFYNRDLVLKGAGVPLTSPFIETARKHAVPVDMSASLFARIAGIPMVGVTGTRGKTTVTLLLERILQRDGRSTLLGGNIKGVSNLSLLDKVTSDSVGVFELDSWQCQGFGERATLTHPSIKQGPRSPEIAVFTTFMSDHMNYYKNDIDAYLRDKANIFLHQTDSDIFVIGRQAREALMAYKREMRAHVFVADESDVPKSWKVPLVGAHNRYNVGVAVVTARALGVVDEIIQEAVETMPFIEGRLELLRTYRGVKIYNDTNATTPDATIVALQALDSEEEKRVILIAGGSDKELDMTSLFYAIPQHTKKCILLTGTGTHTFLKKFLDKEHPYEVASLREALDEALLCAKEGDSILFSPAFASFGMFKNEYDRGEQFTRMVRALA